MRQRDYNIDLLRCVCCFFIVAIHGTPSYTVGDSIGLTNGYGLIVQSLVRVGVPVFLMISGYYLLNEEVANPVKTFCRRVISVVIPFLFYGFINYLAMYRGWELSAQTIKDFIYLAVTNNKGVGYHTWYVYAILGVYIFAPFLTVLFNNIYGRQAVCAIVFLIFLQAYVIYLPLIQSKHPDIHELFYISGIGWVLTYFILGGLVRRVEKQIKALYALTLTVVGYCLTMLALYFSSKSFNLQPAGAGLNMLVFSIGFFLLFTRVTISGVRTKKVIGFISNHSLGCYLIHTMFLVKFLTYAYESKLSAIAPFNTFIAIVLTFLSSLFFAFIFDKVFVKKITSKAVSFIVGRT